MVNRNEYIHAKTFYYEHFAIKNFCARQVLRIFFIIGQRDDHVDRQEGYDLTTTLVFLKIAFHGKMTENQDSNLFPPQLFLIQTSQWPKNRV